MRSSSNPLGLGIGLRHPAGPSLGVPQAHGQGYACTWHAELGACAYSYLNVHAKSWTLAPILRLGRRLMLVGLANTRANLPTKPPCWAWLFLFVNCPNFPSRVLIMKH
ncbi:hypothetical protein TIFTF001_043056 [Ficus carica]|uniref:Uncharacterized protein n=1 Tax=Ficus carica TaxID=3494 RepID=A0AA88CWH8_FICCA|nr:hypothetical protein TIFTF001_043056 [Ficus carica]